MRMRTAIAESDDVDSKDESWDDEDSKRGNMILGREMIEKVPAFLTVSVRV